MAYTVNLYHFSKRKNSTARPSGNGTTFNCRLKDDSGILAPVLILDFRYAGSQPQIFNYAYIPEFSRYYWITNIKYVLGLWEFSLAVDVLASWKTDIGNISTFAYRAQYDSSKRFPDDIYRFATNSTITNTIHAGNFSGNVDNGCFILGIVGSGNTSSIGAMNYYVTNKEGMKAIINALFNDTSWLNISDISADLQKALFNPIQYIKSCMFFPFAMTNINSKTSTTSIRFGWWTMTLNINSLYIINSSPHVELGFTMSIPKHPETSSRGSFVNLSPNTIYQLMYLPYGTWTLDTSILVNYRTLILAQTIDLINGQGCLYVSCYNETTEANDQFDVKVAQIGVPIAVAQLTTDWLGSAISSGINFVNAVANTSIKSMVSGVESLADATLASMVPKAQISGINGGFNTYNLNVILQAQFMFQAPENPSIFGRPCNNNITIRNYPGFIQAEPGNNSFGCMETELTEINNFFTTGFYYE